MKLLKSIAPLLMLGSASLANAEVGFFTESEEIHYSCEGIYETGNLSKVLRSSKIADGWYRNHLKFVYQHTDFLASPYRPYRGEINRPMRVELREEKFFKDYSSDVVEDCYDSQSNFLFVTGYDPSSEKSINFVTQSLRNHWAFIPDYDGFIPEEEAVGGVLTLKDSQGPGLFGGGSTTVKMNIENGEGTINHYQNLGLVGLKVNYRVKLTNCIKVSETVMERRVPLTCETR